MIDFIKKDTIFYIAAPSGFATGGPELLHQLAFKLKEKGRNVRMFYLPFNHDSPVHENYKEYEIDFVREIDDDKKNVLIVPETITNIISEYKNIRKIVWWLSVDNYFLRLPFFKRIINLGILHGFGLQKYFFFDVNLKNIDLHLAQSEYAKSFLNKKNINNVAMLSDYLHSSFLKENTDLELKENIVAYNPKKGISFTKKLMQISPGIEYVAIEKMTRSEVIALLQRAKIYIDFGFHPGKDRIPREAAFLQCCVITNKRGSAYFNKDLSIPDEFKFDESTKNLNLIMKKIESCFEMYEVNLLKFNDYRSEVIIQEKVFDNQIRELFLE